MRAEPRRLLIGVCGLVAVALVALNVTGVIEIQVGPLGDHQPASRDVAGSTVNYDPQRAALYLTAIVENTGPIPATVLGVSPVGETVPGSVDVIGSMPFNSDDPSERGSDGADLIMLGLQPDPGPGWRAPEAVIGTTVEPKGSAHYRGRAFLVRITPDATRETSVLRFDVAYAIGPFRFVTTAWGPVGTTVVMCPRDRPLATDGGCVQR